MCETKLSIVRNNLKQKFASANIDLADVDFILSVVLGVKRTELVFVDSVSKKQLKKIDSFVSLRLKHMPVSKISKKAYFCGFEFEDNKFVLSPRQDSEILVENAVKIIKRNKLKDVLDLCCGSGCLGISVAKLADVNLIATDVSAKALKVAKRNAKKLGVSAKFVKSNLFEKIDGQFDVIISNPPYIERDVIAGLEKEVRYFDPILALDGGVDGLDFYRKIEKEIYTFLKPNGYLILEIGYNQKNAVKNIFKKLKFMDCVADYGGQDRVMIFRREL